MKTVSVLFFPLLLCGNVGYAAMATEPMMDVVQANNDRGAGDAHSKTPIQVPWQKQSRAQKVVVGLGHEPSLRVLLLRQRFEKTKEQRSTAQPQEDIMSPLHEACLWGAGKLFDPPMIDKRLVNARDASGATPLHYVVGCPWFVKPKANDSDEVKRKYEEQCAIRCKIMWALFRTGADPTICDTFGDTPMDYAKEGGHDALVECLKKLIAINGPWDAKEACDES
jgi:hypothetical protein